MYSPILTGTGTGRLAGLCRVQYRVGAGCGSVLGEGGLIAIILGNTLEFPMGLLGSLPSKSMAQIRAA